MQTKEVQMTADCIGAPQPLTALMAELHTVVRIRRLDLAKEDIPSNCVFLLFNPSASEWAAMTQRQISCVVSYVLQGGTLLAFHGAFRNPCCPEIAQMLGARIEYLMPYGEMLLYPAGSEENEMGVVFGEPAIPRQDVFASIVPLMYFRYGIAQYPAIWRHTWGRGAVFCTSLQPQAFLEESAKRMLQPVLNTYMQQFLPCNEEGRR